MKIVTVIGARPQFVKAAMVSRAILEHNRLHPHDLIEESLLHTGQHYDENMSHTFFSEMNIPKPAWQLEGHYSHHGEMTGNMLIAIEKILLETMPDYVLVYGDTNSTLAGALAASKLHIPIVHVEAGLRSFNREMPEEINRVLTDHLSSLLCCPTYAAVHNLTHEGIREGVYHIGDVMYDAALTFGEIAEKSSRILSELQLRSKSFYLCTIHRAENTESEEKLTEIIDALEEIGTHEFPVVLPLHPRTEVYLKKYNQLNRLERNSNIILTPPLSFPDMVMLEKHAITIFTDSGGVQKEAYFHHTPCITLRKETEWVETVAAGWNQVAGYKKEDILYCLKNPPAERNDIPEYGHGNAAETLIKLL